MTDKAKHLYRYYPIPFLLSLLILLSTTGCGAGAEKITYTDLSIEETYTDADADGIDIFFPDTSANVNLTYTLNLGAATKDVFFIFTNTSENNPAVPTVSESMVSARNVDEEDLSLLEVPVDADSVGPVTWRGRPEISEFNRTVFTEATSLSRSLYIPDADPQPSNDITGQTDSFYLGLYNTGGSVAATCKYVSASIGGKVLNIWVANDCLSSGGSKSRLVTDTMVSELAGVFLQAGADNDIYDWVTGIFSEEWGPYDTGYNNLIDENNEITILLYDIDNDDDYPLDNGGIAGYFYAKDNFTTSYYSGSNQRIMFYLDAVMFANGSGTWEIDDPSPADIVSTLAHEFQHMIHFYQKQVVNKVTAGTETWLDEMCSLVAEDFISMKLDDVGIVIEGPRGVNGSIEGAGSFFNTGGRLPLFNDYNYISLTDWPDDDASTNEFLRSYAMSYAFGAHLARNYGGAALFREIVQSGYTDSRAVEYAVDQMGDAIDFSTILRQWGAAVLLSDVEDVLAPYRYNSGNSGFPVDPLGYILGSINLLNYSPTPGVFTALPKASMYNTSNIYYLAGNNLTGTNTWTIQMRDSVRLTVLAR